VIASSLISYSTKAFYYNALLTLKRQVMRFRWTNYFPVTRPPYFQNALLNPASVKLVLLKNAISSCQQVFYYTRVISRPPSNLSCSVFSSCTTRWTRKGRWWKARSRSSTPSWRAQRTNSLAKWADFCKKSKHQGMGNMRVYSEIFFRMHWPNKLEC